MFGDEPYVALAGAVALRIYGLLNTRACASTLRSTGDLPGDTCGACVTLR